jgi:hypothetical protein
MPGRGGAGLDAARSGPLIQRMSRLIDRFNPAITALVGLWMLAFAVHDRLERSGSLSTLVDHALRSLIYVIPIMLAGWAALSLVDRVWGLGLFGTRRDE